MPYVGENDPLSCGCSLDAGRCAKHAPMMARIYEVWRTGSYRQSEALWAESDGYGERGYVPAQGYDWSGIRDSSTEAVEAMYAVANR